MSDTRTLDTAVRQLRKFLRDEKLDVAVGKGAGTIQVRAKTPEDAGKAPKEWEGFRVQVRVTGDIVAQDEFTVGWSPAIPGVVHRVKKSRMVGGGLVAKWQCERGRGETYGAATRPGSARDVTCEECRDAG